MIIYTILFNNYYSLNYSKEEYVNFLIEKLSNKALNKRGSIYSPAIMIILDDFNMESKKSECGLKKILVYNYFIPDCAVFLRKKGRIANIVSECKNLYDKLFNQIRKYKNFCQYSIYNDDFWLDLIKRLHMELAKFLQRGESISFIDVVGPVIREKRKLFLYIETKIREITGQQFSNRYIY